MKPFVVMSTLAALIVLTPLLRGAEPASPDIGAIEKELLGRYQAWESAATSGQGVAHFEKNAADDYVFTSVDGVVSDKRALRGDTQDSGHRVVED